MVVISILTYIVIFMSNNAVFFDFYHGLFYYNIKDTTKAMYMYKTDSTPIEEEFQAGSQVKRLKNLQSLRLKIKPDDNLNFLSNFTSLEDLELSAFGAADTSTLDTLPAIPNLKYIYLSFFEKDGMDFSPLGQLTAMEHFTTYDCNIYDWSFAENLPNLKVIYYINDSYMTDVNWAPLKSAESLEDFTVSIIYYDRSLLDTLEKLPSLKSVFIKFYKLENIPEEDGAYIDDWIGRMNEKDISVQIDSYNPKI